MSDLTQNLLLRKLKPDALDKLAPRLEPIDLRLKQYLAHAGRPLTHVVFPLDAMLSVVTTDEGGTTVEVGTVGRDGFLGIPILLGAEAMDVTVFTQIAGPGLRMSATRYREALDDVPGLREASQLYAQAFFTQLSQSVACNRLHTVEERCARWLLTTHDRVIGDTLGLTQEFLAQMLGVRRASVSLVAKELQNAGLIDYHRGRIEVLDRKGLEEASCACYARIADELRRLLGPWS